jgi:hypothetical protein
MRIPCLTQLNSGNSVAHAVAHDEGVTHSRADPTPRCSGQKSRLMHIDYYTLLRTASGTPARKLHDGCQEIPPPAAAAIIKAHSGSFPTSHNHSQPQHPSLTAPQAPQSGTSAQGACTIEDPQRSLRIVASSVSRSLPRTCAAAADRHDASEGGCPEGPLPSLVACTLGGSARAGGASNTLRREFRGGL